MQIKVKLKDLHPVKVITWNKQQLKLKDNLINDYDPSKGVISISKDFKILDGNHRYSILLNHYGGEYEIDVEQKKHNRRYYVLMFYLLFPFLLIKKILKNARWPR